MTLAEVKIYVEQYGNDYNKQLEIQKKLAEMGMASGLGKVFGGR